MSQNLLHLHPRAGDVDPRALDRWLVELGVAAPSRLGPRFAEWFTCGDLDAAQIQRAIDRPDGSPLALAFATAWDEATGDGVTRVLVGSETLAPLCPCGAPTVDDWPELVAQWWEDREHRWRCACGRITPVDALDFGHTLGFARTSACLAHGLAPDLRPRPALLDELRRRSRCEWTWTWTRT